MRILALLLAFCCCSPALALDWHLGMEAAVTDDGNLQSRVDFHVAKFAFEMTGRHSDFAEVEAVRGAVQRTMCRGYCSTTPVLSYSSGLQWQGSAYYAAFPSHGPVLGYSYISDVDKTVFVGWRAEFGGTW